MTKSSSCCAPAREAGPALSAPGAPPSAARAAPSPAPCDTGRNDAVRFEPARALVGTDTPWFAQDEEGPARRVSLGAFSLARGPVTNAQFAAFVAATAYETEAERFGWSFVFHDQCAADAQPKEPYPGAPWWLRVEGANWRHVQGPGAAPAPDDHPVVQVSWNDARAFAAWAQGRLPSEAEWEHAARAGQGDVPFPWGTAEPTDSGPDFPCNIWQGRFPDHNTRADGFHTTAPARAFAPNAAGLYTMVGNVWEWNADPFRLRSLKKGARARNAQMRGYKLLKGGSFLCHKSYCFRYRIPARTGSSADSATPHQGFRMAWDG